jgi:hypothetical protein
VVAEHDVGAADDQFALAIRVDVMAVAIDDPGGEAGQRQAAGARNTCSDRPVDRHHRRSLCDAVAVQQRHTEPFLELAVQRSLEDGAGRHADAYATQAPPARLLCLLEQIVKNRRHTGQHRELLFGQELGRLRRREMLHDVFACARRDDRDHGQVERVTMIEGQGVQNMVVFIEPQDRSPAGGRHPEDAVERQQHPLGSAGRARRVNDEGGLPDIEGITRRR